MVIKQVKTAEHWRKLLEYYVACLTEENRREYVILAKERKQKCFFLEGLGGDFLTQEHSAYNVRYRTQAEATALQHFVLGDSQSSYRPSVCFGYPFMVGDQGQIMPLIYVTIAGEELEDGVRLNRESSELEPNFAALWDALPGDEKGVALDEIFAKFDDISRAPGDTDFERKLNLLLAQLEDIAGTPVNKIGAVDSRNHTWPQHTVVYCPLLFRVTNRFTGQVLKELEQLVERHTWDEVQPALRQLLTHTVSAPYPEAPDPTEDSRLYVVPANTQQRQAVVSASQRSVTVVTGPPGTGKSQLIVNVVGDAIQRKETVLIASRNNRAVDVVYERFLGKINYPGAVRTGKFSYRQQLPREMQRILAPVRDGGLTSQIEKVRREHEELLQQIEEQRDEIDTIRGLLQDRESYEAELRDLLALLPEALRDHLGTVQIRLSQNEYAQLAAAVHELMEALSTLAQQRNALSEEVLSVLANNRDGLLLIKELEALERRSGTSLDDLYRSTPLDTLEGIQRYLAAWENLVELLVLEEQMRELDESLADIQQEVVAAQQGLPGDWLEQRADASEAFCVEQEIDLRASLESLEADLLDQIEPYTTLVDEVGSLTEQVEPLHRTFQLLEQQRQPTEPAPPTFDLFVMDLFFSQKDQLLRAHEAFLHTSEARGRLESLKTERASKLEEFDAILTDLQAEIRDARAAVAATLIGKIDTAAGKGQWREWEQLSEQLTSLEAWYQRVEEGRLRLTERLRRAANRNWAAAHLQGELDRLNPVMEDLGLLDLDVEWTPNTSFATLADPLHEFTTFAKATALVAKKEYRAEQRQVYNEQIEREIDACLTELSEAENELLNTASLVPKPIADAMLENAWPAAPVSQAVVQKLTESHQAYQVLVERYHVVASEVNRLSAAHTLPMSLSRQIAAMVLPGETGLDVIPSAEFSPLAMSVLITKWLQFSHLLEAEHELRVAERELAHVQAAIHGVRTGLPGRTCQEADFSTIPYSAEMAEESRSSLSALGSRFEALIESWVDIQQRASDLFAHNSLGSKGLKRAVNQARRDPDYLAGLVTKEDFDSIQDLSADLRLWMLVLQVWNMMSTLARLGRRIGQRPRLQEAQLALDRLLDKRQSLAGRVLAEQWRHTAAELAPEVIQGIGYYRDAIEALTGDVGGRYWTFKRQAETHYAQALKLFPIWSTTNLSTQDIPLQAGIFDCVVIDEASQCDIPSALPLLFRAKRIVIIGDEMQLRHIASLPSPQHNQIAEQYQIGQNYSYKSKSLFDLAAGSVTKVPGQIKLKDHYRSHPEIIGFSNRRFYGYLDVRTDLSHIPQAYLSRAGGVYWLDVRGHAKRTQDRRIYNIEEEKTIAQLVSDLVPKLRVLELPDPEIGIVTPFKAQSQRLERAVGRLRVPTDRVLVGTIHVYQGGERDIMILSPVATKELPKSSFGWMADHPNLLNVAVTRARLTLFVVGDHAFFKSLPPSSDYRKLAEYAEELRRVYPTARELPIFLPLEKEEEPFAIGQGIAIEKDSPYQNRMTLRRLLASCEEFLWWYDPYLNIDALDALSLALPGARDTIQEVRLLTSDRFWENQREEPLCMTRKRILPLKREMDRQRVRLRVAVTHYDRDNPPPHDRYLFAANQAVNMPPIKNIYQQTARLAEFLPSTRKPEDFESWWQDATIEFE